MPYIPEEHKQYPVLPYSREHGGEVFQYHNWPEEQMIELVGEHLIPYGYGSYEEYFAKIDKLLQEHSEEPETVRLLERVKEKIAEWNHKEDWSICRFVGDDIGDVLGLHHGGYYYWPCTSSNPAYAGVIDDEEFTAYQFPTDPGLWEIVVDPTGMARRTIYEGVGALTKKDFDYIMDQVQSMKPEDMHNVETLGSIPRLNDCDVVRVRPICAVDTPDLVPGKEYDATVLENGTGKAKAYRAELLEVIPGEED